MEGKGIEGIGRARAAAKAPRPAGLPEKASSCRVLEKSLFFCSSARLRISIGSTRVGMPSRGPSRPRPRSEEAAPGRNARCQGSIGSYDQVTRSSRASGKSSHPASSHFQRSRERRSHPLALPHVGHAERLDHVAPDSIRAEDDAVLLRRGEA
jgi:hypothetical protein